MSSGKRKTGDVAILLSGGLDSVTLLYEAEHQKRLRAAWFVDYGQGGVRQEGEVCSRFMSEWGLVGHAIVVPIPGHTAMLHEPGAEGLRIVPGRNAIMLTLVASWAAAYSIRELWFGATTDDAPYPDCSAEFVDALNRVLVASRVPVTVRAPWVEQGYDKRAVVKRARELNVPLHKTWSCYTPLDTKKPCGTCSACRRREDALTECGTRAL
jgi:7-cyano-7-deazaguanine synthase